MQMPLIEYGNPSIDTLQFINDHSYLDVLFEELTGKQFAFPDNDSSITKAELNDIANKSGILQTDNSALNRYERYDVSLVQFYTDVRFDTKEEADQYSATLFDLFEDVLPLIFKLKHQWQRPRPYQLAHYHKLKLFPFFSVSSTGAAYPSLHACMSKVVANVMSNHYPGGTKYFNDTAADVSLSRIYMGLNYQSSIDMGRLIADKITSEIEFVKKYKL